MELIKDCNNDVVETVTDLYIRLEKLVEDTIDEPYPDMTEFGQLTIYKDNIPIEFTRT